MDQKLFPGCESEGRDWSRRGRIEWLTFALFAGGLVAAGWSHFWALNHDAIAYLRIASYFAQGQWDLAVSGYWGPLLSWLMVPMLKVGMSPLVSARVAMAISACVFLTGCASVYKSLPVAEDCRGIGLVLSALAGVVWSIQFITPDLLVGGLVCLAVGQMARADFPLRPKRAVVGGCLWGLAYLAKAVALPLGGVFMVGAGLLWARFCPGTRRKSWMNLALAGLVFLMVAGPWIGVLSAKYRRITFSTTARIAHAIVGPSDQQRYHPTFRSFHHPASGRITSWEDPSDMPYRFWSPWRSVAYAWHQVKLVVRNAVTTMVLLTTIHLLWPVFLVVIVKSLWRERALSETVAWSLLLMAITCAAYLPSYLKVVDQRYFYGTFPFLWAVGCWSCFRASRRWSKVFPRRWLAFSAAGTVIPLLLVSWLLSTAGVTGGAVAHELNERLRRAGVAGPIAGSGFVGGKRVGLFVAYFLDEPWLGDQPAATPDDYWRSGAELVILNRHNSMVARLDADERFEDLDGLLFNDRRAAADFPLIVFKAVRQPGRRSAYRGRVSFRLGGPGAAGLERGSIGLIPGLWGSGFPLAGAEIEGGGFATGAVGRSGPGKFSRGEVGLRIGRPAGTF